MDMKAKKNRKNANTISSAGAGFDRIDYLAVLPMLLMTGITFLMLIMDLAMPEMYQGQYESYPALFRGANILICLSGLAYYLITLKRDRSFFTEYFKTRRIAIVSFLLFFVCIIVSTLVNGFEDKAIHGVSFRNIGIFHIFVFILIYMFLSSCLKNSGLRKFSVLSFMGVSDLVAAAALVDRFISPIKAFTDKKDMGAIFFNGNHYGYFIVMAVLLSFGLVLYSQEVKIRIFSLISLILNLIVLAYNGSLGCVLAVLIVLAVTPLITHKTHPDMLKQNLIMLAVLAALILAYGISTGMIMSLIEDIRLVITGSSSASTAGHNRWLLWTTTAKYISERPFTGYGCEGLSDILYDELGRANPHNEILSYASQFGIPAACFYVIGVVSTLISSFKPGNGASSLKPGSDASSLKPGSYASSLKPGSNASSLKPSDEVSTASLFAALGYFISSLFGVPMFYTLPFFFIFLGLSVRTDR